ncbi:P-loop containing nucleoside triphosphate hydrolase protein [Mycena olivaceomarginata]|nr:P-loop containing nucleoside triphosphate hydrolase protein [Mycena olivaceomarginata]
MPGSPQTLNNYISGGVGGRGGDGHDQGRGGNGGGWEGSYRRLFIQAAQIVNHCPPPSRIFHGRRNILDKMHQFFTSNMGFQHIYVLHGLGGAGKTQIALKFINESSSRFSDIFLIDSSSTETIDTGLKAIASIKGVGQSPQDALRWLGNNADSWLLFFDNADDPFIDLNMYFPQCDHGNIVITSRNPGLCVYGGANSPVSDMEEVDAVDLLLRSAAQDVTDVNKEAATQIVKILAYLPLAIIQAGAFISKSGNPHSYIMLYEQNQARLLNEKPAQSHDNYAWTVYTTWQISFDQLSQQAKQFLCLCSFLHYQGISEEIFKGATNYEFKPSGPSKGELQLPLVVLSQFSGPTGVWNSLSFMDVTNEIRSSSLINFDATTQMFSMHPLVHDWARGTFSEEEPYCAGMCSIVGMSLAKRSDEEMRLVTPWMLPHVDALIKHSSTMIAEFGLKFGQIYLFGGQTKKARDLGLKVLDQWRETLGQDHTDTLEVMHFLAWRAVKLEVLVLEKRKKILGDSHPDTLSTKGSLAVTYKHLGKLVESAQLGLEVLESRKNIHGNKHPETLRSMANLALTYTDLRRFREAEELSVIVLEGRKVLLGENHPDTVRAMANLACTYSVMKKLGEAEKFCVMALEKRKHILGEEHPETLISMANVASTYYALEKFKEAEEIQVLVLEKRRTILGNSHPSTLRGMLNLASTWCELGKLHEAEKLCIAALEKHREVFGKTHPNTLKMVERLRVIYDRLGKSNETDDLNTIPHGAETRVSIL